MILVVAMIAVAGTIETETETEAETTETADAVIVAALEVETVDAEVPVVVDLVKDEGAFEKVTLYAILIMKYVTYLIFQTKSV